MKLIGTILYLITIAFSVSFTQMVSPESICWNDSTQTYIISDAGAGKLLSMDANGNVTDFTTGLTQPKGITMGTISLWVTDVTDILEIDPKSGEVLNTYPVIGSMSLNDICFDGLWYLYFSDMQGNRIYRMDELTAEITPWSIGIMSAPNGIFYDSYGGLIVVSYSDPAKIYSVDSEQGNVTELMQTNLGQLDGIAYDEGRERYYISSWKTNSVYTVDPSFASPPQLLRSGINGPADMFYNSTTDTLAVPAMNSSQIVFIGFGTTKISIMGSDLVCENTIQTYKVAAAQGKSYRWSVSGGQIQGQANRDSVIIDWGSSGSGSVKIVQTDNLTQAKDSAEIIVEIVALPNVNVLGIKDVCENNIEIYHVFNPSGYSNLWAVVNGEIIGDAIFDTIIVQWYKIPEEEDSLTISGFVTLIQTNDLSGCSNTNSRKINISKKPTPAISGNSSVCAGQTESYSSGITEDANNEWQVSGGGMIGDGRDTILRVVWELPGDGVITLKQVNNLGCSDTARFNVVINPLPEKPVITQTGTTLNSTPAVSYRWFNNGEIIQGETQQTLTPIDSGSYTVEITDENGCKNLSNPFKFNPLSVFEGGIFVNKILIYPQPVTDKIYVKNIFASDITIKIYDILGNILMDEKYSGTALQNGIEVSSLNSGVYMLELTGKNTKMIRMFLKE